MTHTLTKIVTKLTKLAGFSSIIRRKTSEKSLNTTNVFCVIEQCLFFRGNFNRHT